MPLTKPEKIKVWAFFITFLALCVAIPYAYSLKVKSLIEKGIHKHKGGFIINSQDYKCGIVRSKAYVSATANLNGNPIILALENEIEHDPLLMCKALAGYFTNKPQPIAKVHSTVTPQNLDKFKVEQKDSVKFEVDTVIRSDGSITAQSTIPDTTTYLAENQFHMLPAKINFNFDKPSKSTTILMKSPQVAVSSPIGTTKFNYFNMSLSDTSSQKLLNIEAKDFASNGKHLNLRANDIHMAGMLNANKKSFSIKSSISAKRVRAPKNNLSNVDIVASLENAPLISAGTHLDQRLLLKFATAMASDNPPRITVSAPASIIEYSLDSAIQRNLYPGLAKLAETKELKDELNANRHNIAKNMLQNINESNLCHHVNNQFTCDATLMSSGIKSQGQVISYIASGIEKLNIENAVFASLPKLKKHVEEKKASSKKA